MQNPNAVPPTAWPVVEIDGQKLEVRYSFLVTYRASKQRLDIRDLGRGESTFAAHMDLFALCVAHEFEGKDKPAPTGDEWAAKVRNLAHFKDLCDAVRAAMVLAEPKKDVPPNAPLTTETAQLKN